MRTKLVINLFTIMVLAGTFFSQFIYATEEVASKKKQVFLDKLLTVSEAEVKLACYIVGDGGYRFSDMKYYNRDIDDEIIQKTLPNLKSNTQFIEEVKTVFISSNEGDYYKGAWEILDHVDFDQNAEILALKEKMSVTNRIGDYFDWIYTSKMDVFTIWNELSKNQKLTLVSFFFH